MFIGVHRRFNILPALVLCCLVWGCAEDLAPARLDRVLRASWQSYVKNYISPEGRVVIPEQGGETISEAQAYALLRAVWAQDPDTFARVYSWTLNNLSRAKTHGDPLLAWRWGKKADGSSGVLDANTATDGNLDYALALTLAARRGWRPPPPMPPYLDEARRVQAAILEKEVVRLPPGELLLTPGNWREDRPPYLANPSYFSPAAYRLFHQTFGDPRWEELRRDTYPLLARLASGLGNMKGVGLFPDWCRLDAQGRPTPAPDKAPDFGWEAVRLPWRLALDALWFREENPTGLLTRHFLPFMKREWQARGRLAAVYAYDGAPRADYDSPVMYAGVLAAARAGGDEDLARRMADKILSFYQEKDGRAFFQTPDNYYAQNWAWLGLALYAGWTKP